MTVYIAEKPDIARAIAYHIWGTTYQKHNGYFQKDSTIVTWALGHLLELAPPQAYGAQYGSWATFTPIIPKKWILQPNPKSLQQFNTMNKNNPNNNYNNNINTKYNAHNNLTIIPTTN